MARLSAELAAAEAAVQAAGRVREDTTVVGVATKSLPASSTGPEARVPPPPPYHPSFGWTGPVPQQSDPLVLRLAGGAVAKGSVQQQPPSVADKGAARPRPERPPPQQCLVQPKPAGLVVQSEKGGGKGSPHETGHPEWPTVKCSQPECEVKSHWRKMYSAKEYEHYSTSKDDADDKVKFLYLCVKCLAQQRGISETDAHVLIRGQKTEWAQWRSASVKEAKERVKAEFPGLSKKGRMEMTWSLILDEVLKPLGEFVLLKMEQMARRESGLAAHDALLAQFKACTDPNRAKELLEQLEQIERQVDKDSGYLAFQSAEGKQMDFVNIAQYSDEWVQTERGHLRAWYVCMCTHGGTYPPCGTVMAAKHWARKFDAPTAVRQKWYCVCCATRFRTAYGMLVQFSLRGHTMFCWAPVSNADIEDVRAMYLEKKLAPKDPMALWNAIKDVAPTDFDWLLRQATPHELQHGADVRYVWRFRDVKQVEQLPKFDWDDIFAHFG